MAKAKRLPECVDCRRDGVTTIRKPALTRSGKPVPGKRCVTHERVRKATTKLTAREKHLLELYDLSLEEYDAIKDYQGGKCAICQRATGATRALAVDHDHATGYVRGTICATDNKILGHARDSVEFFKRAIDYLENPPAFAVIGKRIAPIEAPNLNRNQGRKKR
ncbi:EndoVII [Mycobacterium phage Barriga]|uniref:endonuclease VII n=1 Tax=Mycobacterium phage Barriga TaxID=1675548 RepID=UPI0006A2A972|nr:endonuclease VII [Mycobacterium phage Barriga]AKU44929.1 EndoVII [Mycobacterium phage Barriga]